MPGVITEPSVVDVRTYIEQIEDHLRRAAREQRKPPPQRVPPTRVPGFWQSFEGAAAALAIAHDIGYGSGAQRRGQEALASISEEVRRTGTLEWRDASGTYTAKVSDVRDMAREVIQQFLRFVGVNAPGEPTPAVAGAATGRPLSRIVGWLTSWRVGHHKLVHRPDAVAAQALAGAEAGAGAAIDGALLAAAEHLRYLSERRIPAIRDGLSLRIAALREDMVRGDHRLDVALNTVERTLTRELQQLAREIRTEWIPKVTELIETEAAIRAKADRALQRGLAEETDARIGTDTLTMAAIAPLAAWASSFGVHTTTKVKTMEPMLDQMLGPSLPWMGALLIPGAFGALVAKMIVDVAGAVPEVLISLEDQAARVLAVSYGD
jgi:hypothetical protein